MKLPRCQHIVLRDGCLQLPHDIGHVHIRAAFTDDIIDMRGWQTQERTGIVHVGQHKSGSREESNVVHIAHHERLPAGDFKGAVRPCRHPELLPVLRANKHVTIGTDETGKILIVGVKTGRNRRVNVDTQNLDIIFPPDEGIRHAASPHTILATSSTPAVFLARQ